MSRQLRRGRQPYLQSPVDDIFSFFYSALWATLWNENIEEIPSELETWRQKVRGTSDNREAVIHDLVDERFNIDLPKIVRDMNPLLQEWHKGLDALVSDWIDIYRGDPEKFASRFPPDKLLEFDIFAYRGVLLFAELALKHKARLSTK